MPRRRVARRGAGEYGLEFIVSDKRRVRLQERLDSYMAGGLQGLLRIHHSSCGPGETVSAILESTGDKITCTVNDRSLDGMSFNAHVRPPIGEIVKIGGNAGRVIRHSENGFAIRYVIKQ